MRPKLQVAMDITDLNKAIDIAKKVDQYVDIVEIGTILAIQCGMEVVKALNELPHKAKILADIRIIKAGKSISKLVYQTGADIITVISDATEETLQAVVNEKNKYSDKEILLEINENYTDKQLHYWLDLGIKNIIFHRSSEYVLKERDWGHQDFIEIERLHKMGFKVGVTGGISFNDLHQFKGVPVDCFIIGRSISKADHPDLEAKKYMDEIKRIFGE
ncbi:3-dehydro-L-gulonate-6-phosphate decarboxylase UlaD [Aerococcus christensenii]|uniref:3-hexulose-6-phosphate synthase n=1 Tax=Aerococcus christensenii TaxID=87541 RepID=A0A0X8F7Y3_9LACT|nr:orotidine 5'-phosphate decarboxylase / HUMPS family protein [Aerococcus christensenii]AMB92480.1 hypothetical protein AWM71_03810 [Aerococcus christensenii]PKY91033.1 3-dehydro-L-gulonate-6-phosphate decarboxylase UlaD [Aerococcus christensenii]